MTAVVRTLSAPGVRVEYARLPPAATPSLSMGHAVGVAFTPQSLPVWEVAGLTRRRPFAPSSVFIVPAEGLRWQAWDQVSESVEMWIDGARLDRLSRMAGGPAAVRLDYREAIADPVIVNVASLFRAAMAAPAAPDAMRLEALGTFLATHLLDHHLGLDVREARRIRPLGRAEVQRVSDFVAAHLDGALTLDALAGVAGRSPFHFAKAFKLATGSAPHAFVHARRMERAMVLLRQSPLTLREIARRVGFTSLSHFRARFRLAWGEPAAGFRRARV